MHTDDDNLSEECRAFLRNLLQTGKQYAFLFCGSSFELPLQYVIAFTTDADTMFIPNDICALPLHQVLSTPRGFQGRRLTVDTEDTHPGFAKLRTIDGKRFHWQKMDYPQMRYHKKHGPAWTRSLLNPFNEETDIILGCGGGSKYQGYPRRLLEIKLDRVFAIYCPCWPSEADEWKTRERPNGWPPVDVIDKIVASGCYFVAKPHHTNPDDDTQWRFSFSQAELILIHSWTDVQKYIYHILRLIKSEVVDQCGGSDEAVLCTYFFKTLMLWESERKPQNFWDDANVENSVRELLCIMIEWLIDGCCPNYFIPECNMISAATERVDFSKEIQLLLNYMMMDVTKLTTIWQKAHSKRTASIFYAPISEEILLLASLFQIRDNLLNPLNPTMKTKLSGKLTSRNSLLCSKVNDLCRGIMAHLRFMSQRCPIAKGILAQEALRYYLKPLQEIGNQCSPRAFSIGESIYETIERFNRAVIGGSKLETEPKSTNDHSDQVTGSIHTDINQRNSQAFHVDNGDRRFICCYSREEEARDGTRKRVRPVPTNESINVGLFVRILCQNSFARAFAYKINVTRVIGLAYLANFYYTALRDYKMTLTVCETVLCIDRRDSEGGRCYLNFSERAIPLFITNRLSAIFDEHFRTVLGLITLYGCIAKSLQDDSTVLIRICSVQLATYLRIQCMRREGIAEPLLVDEPFRCTHAFTGWYDTYEPSSEVFMSAVLCASSSGKT